jgi:NADH dehydrogenase FAD-containing subunit
VGPTLQVENLPSSRKNIFALGDVAQSGGPKQARAGFIQGEIVTKNLLRLMRGGPAVDKYVPHFIENTLNLTLGKVCAPVKLLCAILCLTRCQGSAVMWVQKGDYEWMKETKGADEDLNVRQTRWRLNAKEEQ